MQLRRTALATVLLLAGGVAAGSAAAEASDVAGGAPMPESCRVPGADPAAAAPSPAWSEIAARLAAEVPRAEAAGFRPLGTRGYNYARERSGLDPAALQYEAGR